MPIEIQDAAGTSLKTKDPSLHKGNTGSQTLDYGLLPAGVDSYVNVNPEISLSILDIYIFITNGKTTPARLSQQDYLFKQGVSCVILQHQQKQH